MIALRHEKVVLIVSVRPRWPYVGAVLNVVLARGVLELAVLAGYLWWLRP